MNTSLLLFDIDWTLLKGGLSEHLDGFSYAWKKVLGIDAKLSDWPDHHGQPDCVLLAKIPQLSNGISESVIGKKINLLKQAKSEYFFAHALPNYSDKLMPGVKDLLEALKAKKIPMVIKSGNLEAIGWERLKRAGIADYFIGGGWGSNVSSKSQSVEMAINVAEKALHQLFEKQNIYDIGDSHFDVEADKLIGIRSIAVATGHDSVEQLKAAGAEFILKDLTDKKAFLKIINLF